MAYIEITENKNIILDSTGGTKTLDYYVGNKSNSNNSIDNNVNKQPFTAIFSSDEPWINVTFTNVDNSVKRITVTYSENNTGNIRRLAMKLKNQTSQYYLIFKQNNDLPYTFTLPNNIICKIAACIGMKDNNMSYDMYPFTENFIKKITVTTPYNRSLGTPSYEYDTSSITWSADNDSTGDNYHGSTNNIILYTHTYYSGPDGNDDGSNYVYIPQLVINPNYDPYLYEISLYKNGYNSSIQFRNSFNLDTKNAEFTVDIDEPKLLINIYTQNQLVENIELFATTCIETDTKDEDEVLLTNSPEFGNDNCLAFENNTTLNNGDNIITTEFDFNYKNLISLGKFDFPIIYIFLTTRQIRKVVLSN